MIVARCWRRGIQEFVFSGCRVSILEYEKRFGGFLHNHVNVLNGTEVHAENGYNGKFSYVFLPLKFFNKRKEVLTHATTPMTLK